ncbi:uncharacterized protein CC84DRAFT_439135 [Paraphaeosphaeria sporulosa]|uniref:Uncharacterized protein n=1 Tax=Paraphaeosphaeria sporulosa TaxID=1460663 RepID=A0A177CRD8_9PLEO|nr:uncharacterized protein CC84DRAFT_439135 [Paraphaeosphaeria sporulosa]OAG09502.1 hypothetical protein CC84DRAFT_439135 [Paraphaeosphaeria sporulosa]
MTYGSTYIKTPENACMLERHFQRPLLGLQQYVQRRHAAWPNHLRTKPRSDNPSLQSNHAPLHPSTHALPTTNGTSSPTHHPIPLNNTQPSALASSTIPLFSPAIPSSTLLSSTPSQPPSPLPPSSRYNLAIMPTNPTARNVSLAKHAQYTTRLVGPLMSAPAARNSGTANARVCVPRRRISSVGTRVCGGGERRARTADGETRKSVPESSLRVASVRSRVRMGDEGDRVGGGILR